MAQQPPRQSIERFLAVSRRYLDLPGGHADPSRVAAAKRGPLGASASGAVLCAAKNGQC